MKRILPYISYLWRFAAGYRRTTALRTLLGIVRVSVMLAFVWLSKTAIDCATGRIPSSTATLILWFALMALCMLTDLLLAQWVRYIESRSTMLLTNGVNRRLFSVLMMLPLTGSQSQFHSGDMLNRLTLDVRTLATFILSQLPSMVVMLFQLLASFAFLAWLNPYLALAPLLIMPLCVLGAKLYFRRQRAITAEIRTNESAVHVAIQEGLRHRLLLQSLECLGEIDRRLSLLMQSLDNSNRTQARLSSLSGAITRFGFVAGFLTAFGWGIFSLKAGVITFGTMTAFLQLVNRIQNPIANLAGYIPSFISTSVAIDRLREIDLPLAPSSASNPLPVERATLAAGHSSAPHSPLPSAGVRVADLTFSYTPSTPPILSHFSHDFTPGSRTMIVGATGAGKTTLIKLLLGLLRPQSGTVELYAPASTSTAPIPVGPATLSNFVYVPQGNSLLHGTIRDNLLLAYPAATPDEMAAALHTAVADFVFTLPQGLDTPCHEAGAGLSEGQAQRIAIARALLRPGSILLLDEFNSALDPSTASTLMERIAAHHPTSTLIIIAHHRTAIAPHCTSILTIA